MKRVNLVSKQSGKKDVLVDDKYFATAIKIDGGVTLDHIQPDDSTIYNINKPDGKLIKTWTATEDYIYDILNEEENNF